MKNTRAGDGARGGIRSVGKGVIKAKACKIMSGGEYIELGMRRGRFS